MKNITKTTADAKVRPFFAGKSCTTAVDCLWNRCSVDEVNISDATPATAARTFTNVDAAFLFTNSAAPLSVGGRTVHDGIVSIRL